MHKFFRYSVALCAVAMLVLPLVSSAVTTDELQVQVNALLQQINALQAQLSQVQNIPTDTTRPTPVPPPVPIACHDFRTNLKVGDRGAEVYWLQKDLELQGFSISDSEKAQRDGEGMTGVFGESTASAVTGFQEKYASEILKPAGLSHGTGYVGPGTRAKLNKLYGCGITVPAPITPVPAPTSTPPTQYPDAAALAAQLASLSAKLKTLPFSGSEFQNVAQLTKQVAVQLRTLVIANVTATKLLDQIVALIDQLKAVAPSSDATIVAALFAQIDALIGHLRTAIGGGSAPVAVKIMSMNPSSGLVGTAVSLVGSGFTASGNTVSFETTGGVPYGIRKIENLSSAGNVLNFQVPRTMLRLSEAGNSEGEMTPGTYQVVVSNANGKSNLLYFRVTSSDTGTPGTHSCVFKPYDGQSYVTSLSKSATVGSQSECLNLAESWKTNACTTRIYTNYLFYDNAQIRISSGDCCYVVNGYCAFAPTPTLPPVPATSTPPTTSVCAGPGLRADIYGGPSQQCCSGLVLQGGVCNVVSQPTNPPLPASLPDLTVFDIYSDSRGAISVKIGNIGSASAPSNTGSLYIWIDDQLKWTYSLSTLYDQSFLLPGGTMVGQPQILSGTHKIKAVIDPNGVITESNESNNMLEKTVTFAVTTPTPTPTPTPPPVVTIPTHPISTAPPQGTTNGDLSIPVKTPNDGGGYPAGSTLHIQWNSSVSIDKVTIGYKTCASCLNWIVNNMLVPTGVGTGGYVWGIPSTLTPGSNYQIYIIGYQTGVGSVADTSDGTFSILPAGASPVTAVPSLSPETASILDALQALLQQISASLQQ